MTWHARHKARSGAFSAASFQRSDIARMNRAAGKRVLPYTGTTAGIEIQKHLARLFRSHYTEQERAIVNAVLDEGFAIIAEHV
jgi:hypothetical protein